jgi:hypothetical protein
MTFAFNRCPEHRGEKQALCRKAFDGRAPGSCLAKHSATAAIIAREIDRHRRVEDFAERNAQPHAAASSSGPQ